MKGEIEARRIFDTLKVILGVDFVEPADQVELLEEWAGYVQAFTPNNEDLQLSVCRPRSGLTLLVAYLLYGLQTRRGAAMVVTYHPDMKPSEMNHPMSS